VRKHGEDFWESFPDPEKLVEEEITITLFSSGHFQTWR
jgi:hypothetical protein